MTQVWVVDDLPLEEKATIRIRALSLNFRQHHLPQIEMCCGPVVRLIEVTMIVRPKLLGFVPHFLKDW